MSKDMMMYRHEDETRPPRPIILPDMNGLIFQPIRFTHEEAQWMEMMEELNRLLIEALAIPPQLVGEITINRVRG